MFQSPWGAFRKVFLFASLVGLFIDEWVNKSKHIQIILILILISDDFKPECFSSLVVATQLKKY